MLAVITLAVLLAGWNNVLHLAPTKQREFVVAAGVTAAGVAGAAWLSTWVNIAHGWSAALPWAAATLLGGGLLACLARLAPRVGQLLVDQRIVSMSRVRFAVHTAFRIPFVSGLSEEVLFRGVMWALLTPFVGTTWTLAITSLAFGLWHVVVSAQQAQRMGQRTIRWVALNVVITAGAGLLFGWLRLETGGVWAPAAVHAFVNTAFAVAARVGAAHHRRPAAGNRLAAAA